MSSATGIEVDSKLTLTAREIEVATLAVAGYSAKQGASKLGMAEETYKGYRARINRKYFLQGRGVDNVAVLLRRMIEDGHVPEIHRIAP